MNALIPAGRPARTPIRLQHEIRLRLAQVIGVEILSPRMRRIVFGGDALAGFTTAAPDDHVKLFFPAPSQDKPTLPTLGPNGPAFPEGAERPVVRDYTPRRFDAASNTLTVEFALHGNGPAANWARTASPGQWLGIGGPRGSLLVPEDYDTYLLAGDETALPAIARRLEEMQPGARAIALIEVENGDEERHLPTATNASIRWLHRNGRAAGQPDLLEQALRSVQLPDGDTHAWLAGEIDTIRRLRTHLTEDRKIPRTNIKAAGYWRIGVADAHGKIE
ncbi:MAG: siderophore-interacting protein [Janthinobacterium lividum]